MNPLGQMTHADVDGSLLTLALLQSQKCEESTYGVASTPQMNTFCVSVAQLELKFCRSCSQNK